VAVAVMLAVSWQPPDSVAGILRVDKTATGTPVNGSSWSQAYRELRDALAAAQGGDEVWVAAAATPYTPHATGLASASFEMENNVRIYGGFDGTESNRSERDFETNETILSGETGVTDSDIVVRAIGVLPSAVLDGFTIEGAVKHGILVSGGSPTLENLIIQDITSDDINGGAGILVTGVTPQPTFTNCKFSSNSSDYGGGAVACDSMTFPEFYSCQFYGNSSEYWHGGAVLSYGSPFFSQCEFGLNDSNGLGGAIHHSGSGRIEIRNSDFVENGTIYSAVGGALYLASTNPDNRVVNTVFDTNMASAYGGAVALIDDDARFDDCTFVDNTADKAGAIYAFSRNAAFVNCVFVGNEATSGNGGALETSYSDGEVQVINCTITENSASGYGGGIYRASGDPEIRNSILWNNSANSVVNEAAQLDGVGTLFYITNSCIHGLSSFAGNGNIGDNPSFMDVGSGDYRLDSDSPCIDVGNSTDVPNDSADVDDDHDTDEATPDLALNPRLQSFRLPTATDGCLSRIVDMGAFEFAVDCDNDMLPDEDEISANPGLDTNEDGILDACQDCDSNSIPDPVQIAANPSLDCNNNCILDLCDISNDTSDDLNEDGVPDECQDCNSNGILDPCEVDCGAAQGPCDVEDCGTATDCNSNGIPDDCEPDCNDNGTPDDCEFIDCNGNCVDDDDELSGNDCNSNGIPDDCEIAADRTWTTDSDFAEGILLNLNLDTSGQLQRNVVAETSPFPFLWAANATRGTIVRVATEDFDGFSAGDIIGEYESAPEQRISNGSLYPVAKSPSRTTVDLDGSMWAANRNDNFGDVGSIVKIGIVVGGTRTDASGTPDANGGYLAPPFEYCTCEDRDADGLIRTSAGLGDILSWDNIDGLDETGGVKSAEDECILRYVRVAGTGARTIAVGKDNNVWVGGYTNREHEKIDGFTGLAFAGTQFDLSTGGYGGLIDCNGFLWSAGNGPLLRINTSDLDDYQIITYPDLANNRAYGMGFDTNENIWVSNLDYGEYDTVQAFEPDGDVIDTYATGGHDESRGVAVTPADNHIWVANSQNPGNNVSRLENDGDLVAVISVGPDGGTNAEPTGVAVDRAGKVWVTNRLSSTLKRINPATNAVDLSVDLNCDTTFCNSNPDNPCCTDAYPYNYSDLTGMVGLMTSATGMWSVVHDSGRDDTEWCRLEWNNETCTQAEETTLEVYVRASNNEAALPLIPFERIEDSPAMLSNLIGRYVQIRVRFVGSCPSATFATPTLCDLTIYENFPCKKGDVNGDGAADGDDVQPFVDAILNDLSCDAQLCGADTNSDRDVTVSDIPCFVKSLLGVDECGGYCPGFPRDDKNNNGVPDDEDIAFCDPKEDPGLCDCNKNGIPDAVDILNETSEDANENSIPDECEPDCNGNDVPDDLDIANETSEDCNENGVPDECDQDCDDDGTPDDCETLIDCNENGIFDACELDCDNDGVPDACELSGNDCNENGLPDDCEVNFPPPWNLPDCNNNNVPDVCELSGNDCNSNGILDECDIANEVSEDANENSIPDECESQQQMMGGGEQLGLQSSLSEFEEADAWADYFDWCAEADFSSMNHAEIFSACLAKRLELGLPAGQTLPE